MQYAAILVTPDGGFIRHQQTQEVANILIGDLIHLMMPSTKRAKTSIANT